MLLTPFELSQKEKRPIMPKGPKGQKRPGNVIGTAVQVAQIATGEREEDRLRDSGKNKAAQELGRLGSKARALKMSAKQRQEIAQKAANARWAKKK